MNFILYLLLQLLTYGPWWILFVALVFCAARYTPWFCIPFSFLIVAIVIYCVDFNWVQSEMRKPGWDGTPDLDMIFMCGLLLRIALASIVLTPICVTGTVLRRRSEKRLQAQTVAKPLQRLLP